MPQDSTTLIVIVVLTVIAAGCLALLWTLLALARRIEKKLERLDRLDAIEAPLARLAAHDEGLDLRRIEHVLLDVRDALKRTEERMLTVIEARAAQSNSHGALVQSGPFAGSALIDRVLSRLLTLGYERVHVVTAPEEVAKLADGSGFVVVEARRDGATCKGKVRIERGLVTDLEIQPAYTTFP